MSATTKKTLLFALSIVVVMLLMLSGGAITGTTLSGGMMDNGTLGEFNVLWLLTLTMLGLGALLVWVLVQKNQ